uniref:Uncharacterized protein n=1 Tax=Psilocybe cubensis TaxID=181762 RepID=A0A8H7Y1H3_PSICU
MSYNTSIFSKIMLAQNGADETEAGEIATLVVYKRLQDGNAVSPTLGVTHGPLNHESAAQETPMPVTDLSLDWTKLGDIDLTLMNEYFNDPAAMSWDNPPYHPPTSVQMDNIQGELAAPFASSSVACQESFNDSNIGRTMSHAPINSFDIVYEPTMGAISAPIFPFQQHMSVGTSRRQTNLPHQRGTPYRAIWSLPNPVPHHGQDDGLGYLGGAYSIQDTSILPSPAFGETRHQNGTSENQGRNELYGSGSTPVEPTSTTNAGSSGNSRRFERQSKPESGSVIRKRAPRSS